MIILGVALAIGIGLLIFLKLLKWLVIVFIICLLILGGLIGYYLYNQNNDCGNFICENVNDTANSVKEILDENYDFNAFSTNLAISPGFPEASISFNNPLVL